MKKLEEKLLEIKQRGRIGLMTHVVIGYPSLEATVQIVKTMANNGADVIELQIPFSDPIADGPTIMKACEDSLKNGTRVQDAFMIMNQLAKEVSVPLLFMGYYNTMFTYGVEKFCQIAKQSGASGLIFPDIALEEEPQEHYRYFANKYELAPISVISPVSTDSRLEKNAYDARGFVYCTARLGITGAQKNLDPNIISYLHKVKTYFSIPAAVGFGISKKEHIQSLQGHADIAVVGSALIDVINISAKNEIEKNITKFLQRLH